MRTRFLFSISLLFLCISFLLPVARAEILLPEVEASNPSDLYSPLYLLRQEGVACQHRGEMEAALERFLEAERGIAVLREKHPDWNAEAMERFASELRASRTQVEEVLAESRLWEIPLRVHFIDVGHGDCALVQCPDGSNILIDGGPMNTWPYVVDYLRGVGVEKIDLMIATHPHADHIGGLPKILEEFPVGTVLDSGRDHTTMTYQRFLENIKARPDTQFRLGRAGQSFRFGNVELSILHPAEPPPSNLNDASVVARLVYGGTSFLFAGDAEAVSEGQIMGRGYPLRSTVLKVGHHGSTTSTTPAFLAAVAPQVAVISCPRGSSKHPGPEIIQRLEAAGIAIYRTDINGTIVLSSNGKEYRLDFPGGAAYRSYEVAPEYEGKVIGDRCYRIFHLPGGRYYRSIPHEGRTYFDTESEAVAAGYEKSWQ